MKKKNITTTVHRLMGDLYTPVGIYLRLRDRFRDTLLLESTDHQAASNSYSFICVNAIGGIEVQADGQLEQKFPGEAPEKLAWPKDRLLSDVLWDYMQAYETPTTTLPETGFSLGLYGYTSFDAIPLMDKQKSAAQPAADIPLVRYRLYQYVIAFNHFKDEIIVCENHLAGLASEWTLLETLIRSKDVPVFPFQLKGQQASALQDQAYQAMVQKGIQHCQRGDVFQVVLSRRFEQGFSGDEFNVYRALRHINPSPYLFFFDYGDYKIMGSSPEAQLVVSQGKAVVHPIAGTFQRTGDDAKDQAAASALLANAKENAEHVMLVDLARNDLSRICDEVEVVAYKQVHYYSHVIHLVSEVQGKVKAGTNPFAVLAKTFPAGTLSGAPKVRAMEIIADLEPHARGFYGGALGFVGFDGSCNQAIMIRSFLSRGNVLYSQAGAGVVALSQPLSEMEEVNNKLGALHKALQKATQLNPKPTA
ncbi:MAG: anthranilate synthase component I family protein [Sphingobacteriia bacterium]|nr:MAG: anthranilate synthase component I family protein [Sphingobacteriia bacterium]